MLSLPDLITKRRHPPKMSAIEGSGASAFEGGGQSRADERSVASV